MNYNDKHSDIIKTHSYVVKSERGYDYSYLSKTQAQILAAIKRIENLQQNMTSFMSVVSFQPSLKDMHQRQLLKDIEDCLRHTVNLCYQSFKTINSSDITIKTLNQARLHLDKLCDVVTQADNLSLWRPAIAGSLQAFVSPVHVLLIEAIATIMDTVKRQYVDQSYIATPISSNGLADWLGADQSAVAAVSKIDTIQNMSATNSQPAARPNNTPGPAESAAEFVPNKDYGPQSNLPIKNVLGRHSKLKNNVDKTLMHMLGQVQARNGQAQNNTVADGVMSTPPAPKAPAVSTKDGQARLDKILMIVSGVTDATMSDVEQHFSGVTRKTLQRDLAKLISQNKITKTGTRRWAVYNVVG